LQSGLGVDAGGGGLDVYEGRSGEAVELSLQPQSTTITSVIVSVSTTVVTTVTVAVSTTVTVSGVPQEPPLVGDVELSGTAEAQSSLLADEDKGAL